MRLPASEVATVFQGDIGEEQMLTLSGKLLLHTSWFFDDESIILLPTFLTHWLIGSMTHWITDSQNHWLTESLTDWLTDGVTEWLTLPNKFPSSPPGYIGSPHWRGHLAINHKLGKISRANEISGSEIEWPGKCIKMTAGIQLKVRSHIWGMG